MGHAIGNGPIQIINAIARYFIRNIFFLRLQFIQAHARHFGVNKGRPGHHRIIDFEFFKIAEQSINRGIPSHMRRRVRKLIWPRYVTGGKNIGIQRFQIVVSRDHAFCWNTQLFQSKAFQARHPAHSTQ